MQIQVTLNNCATSSISDAILLVQNDTNPSIILSITTDEYNHYTNITTTNTTDISNTTIVLKLRKVRSNTVFAIVPGILLTGIMDYDDGSINTDPPYDIPGVGGRVQFDWLTDSLTESGMCQGEIQITYDNGIATVYDILPIRIRQQF
jgi:hypothetical protein